MILQAQAHGGLFPLKSVSCQKKDDDEIGFLEKGPSNQATGESGRLGFLVVDRVAEKKLGATVAEGGAAGLLKVIIGLSNNILTHSLIFISRFHKFTGR